MEKEKRHTCIYCKRKRNENFMQQIVFNSWSLPNQEIQSFHWVCKDRRYRYSNNCFEMTINVKRPVTITAVNVRSGQTNS